MIPQALKLTIAGVDRTSLLETGASIELLLNDKSSLTIQTKFSDYLPNRYDEVILSYIFPGPTEVIVYGGFVTNRTVAGIIDPALPRFNTFECKDFFKYLDFTTVAVSYTVDTLLKQVLSDALAALPGSTGIVIDPSQEDGPTVAPFSSTDTVSNIIRSLTDKTGYVGKVDPTTKYAKMILPGTEPAPLTITDVQPNCDSVEWSDPDSDPPTDISLIIGAVGVAVVQHWVAPSPPGTVFVTDFSSALDGYGLGFLVTINDGSVINPTTGRFDTVSIPGGGGYWEWDESAHTLTQVGGPGIIAGDTIDFQYRPAFPCLLTYSTGKTPKISQPPIVRPEIITKAEADGLGYQLLASLSSIGRRATIKTREIGWFPGQLIQISIASRSI